MAEKNFFETKKSINVGGKALDLSKPSVMGILNVTPDSFFKESRAQHLDEVLKRAEVLLNEGAVFLDIGGYSSRPGAKDITVDEELNRVIPAVEAIAKAFPEAVLSIDTFRARVAEESIGAGAHLINDISAGDLDQNMFPTIAKLQVPYIIMHMQGTPQNMQQNPVYEDVLLDVIDYFSQKITALKALHIHDVIIDPGFGFGKTISHNYELLNRMEAFKIFSLPLLAGFSRKGMIHKVLGNTAAEALNGTTVLNTVALQKGAGILRVHDVKETLECIKLVEQLNG